MSTIAMNAKLLPHLVTLCLVKFLQKAQMKPPLSERELLLELHPESLRSDYFRTMFLESSPLLSSPRLSDRTSVFQGSGCVDAAPF